MYENVHPNLAMVLLFVRTEVECGKGLLGIKIYLSCSICLAIRFILDYISRISLVFMLQEQIWSRDHSNATTLKSTKYKILFYIIYD